MRPGAGQLLDVHVYETLVDGQHARVLQPRGTIQEAATQLESQGISCEIIDVQTLLPFDLQHKILDSLKKTSRILFVDEDVPGGACAYMYNKVMEEQGGYRFLDVAPRTITGKAHRPGYGSDGDYFGKPNAEEIETIIKEMMAE